MSKIINIPLFHGLSKYMTTNEFKKFIAIIVFALLLGILETLSIFMIWPFIKILQNPAVIISYLDKLHFHPHSTYYTNSNIVISSGLLLSMLYIFKNVISFKYIIIVHKFAGQVHARLSQSLLIRHLNMSYAQFIRSKITDFQGICTQYVTIYRDTIISFLLYISDVSLLAIMLLLLLIINYQVTFAVIGILGAGGFILLRYLGIKNRALGIQNRHQLSSTNQQIYNALFNFKIVKLFNMHKLIIDDYQKEVTLLNQINAQHKSYAFLPRHLIEVFSFAIIVIGIILGISSTGNLDKLLPIIGFFLIALLKLAPSLSRMSGILGTIRYNEAIMNALDSQTLDLPNDSQSIAIEFKQQISLRNVTFTYPGTDGTLFKNLNLVIKKDQKIGIIGASGAGKSTLLDLIMGFLTPNTGGLYIDDQLINSQKLTSWQQKIGYVPQEIFLYDDTVLKNIVLNRYLDNNKLIAVLKKAHIYEFCLANGGVSTQLLGNNGSLISGGQKQRIGIARALYGDPELLILDEATSALDDLTEQKIMDEIYLANSDKTIILVTHRKAALKYCDTIFDLDKITA